MFLTGSKSEVLVVEGGEEVLTVWYNGGMYIMAGDGALGDS